MESQTCSYLDTRTGDPCGHPVPMFANHCRANHPARPLGTLADKPNQIIDLYLTPAPFEMEDLISK